MKSMQSIRAVALTAVAALTCSLALAQTTQAAQEKKQELQRLYSKYLTDEGYQPQVDSDGDVQFKREGRTYFISVSGEDPTFVRVVLPAIWRIEGDARRPQVLAAADYATGSTKATKVYTVKDRVWVSTEGFVSKPEELQSGFKRYISALDTGMRRFAQQMAEKADK